MTTKNNRVVLNLSEKDARNLKITLEVSKEKLTALNDNSLDEFLLLANNLIKRIDKTLNKPIKTETQNEN